MAFSSYDHDVFISYAHVDDLPRGDARDGWVTTLLAQLRSTVDMKLGRIGACEFWMDDDLKLNEDVTPQLMDAVGRTAVLVIVLTPGYLASDWCRRENETFLEEIRSARWAGSRVFLVEIDEVDRDSRPKAFRDRLTYKFWARESASDAPRTFCEAGLIKEDPHYFDYFNSLKRLAVDIANELTKLSTKATAGPTSTITQVSPDAPAAFVAEVTEDLLEERGDLVSYLDQAGFRALPKRPYVRDASFASVVKGDLAQCKLFVQLLSGVRGASATDSDRSYPRVQYDIARESGKLIVQWRAEGIDVPTVKNADQRELLQTSTVRAEGFEEFKGEVKRRLSEEPKPVPAKGRVGKALVFVDGEPKDWDLATSIRERLRKLSVEVSLPTWQQPPDRVREDLEENLKNCDALIVVYGNATASWVKSQLFLYRKVIALRDRPLDALAVYQGPPGDQPSLNLDIDNLRLIDCTNAGEDDMEAQLQQFIGPLA